MLFIIILCNCSVPSQLWAASVSHWVKRIARCKFQNRLGLGAVLGISAVSATFSRIFSGFWAGFGCCFRDFCSFSYFFPGLFRLFGWILGAVLGISAVSATFSQIFSGFWAGFWVLFWGFLRFQLLFPRFFPDFELSLGAVLEVLGITATKIALMKQH